MSEKYTNQVIVLHDSTKVDNKLLIIAIYNELYSWLKSVSDEKEFANKIDYVLVDTFDRLLMKLNYDKNKSVYTTAEFFAIFMKELRNHELLKGVKEREKYDKYITYFEEQIPIFINGMDFVDTINSCDKLNLFSKTELATLFREKLRNVISKTDVFNEITADEITSEVYKALNIELKSILLGLPKEINSMRDEESFINNATIYFDHAIIACLKYKYDRNELNIDSLHLHIKNKLQKCMSPEEQEFYIKKLMLLTVFSEENEKSAKQIKNRLCTDFDIGSMKYYLLSQKVNEVNKQLYPSKYARKRK